GRGALQEITHKARRVQRIGALEDQLFLAQKLPQHLLAAWLTQDLVVAPLEAFVNRVGLIACQDHTVERTACLNLELLLKLRLEPLELLSDLRSLVAGTILPFDLLRGDEALRP